MERIHDIDKLLQTGIDMMVASGYHHTSINAVIKAAELPKGSFYYLYKDKKSFALDALRRYIDQFATEFAKLASNDAYTPVQVIRQFFQQNIDAFEKANFSRGCFLGNMSQEMSDIDEEFRVVILGGFNQIRASLSGQLKMAQEIGEVGSGVNTDTLADLMLSSYHGALLRMKASKTREPLDNFMNEFFFLLNRNE